MVVATVGAIAAAEVITMDGGGAEAIITDGGTIIAVGGDYKLTGSRVTISPTSPSRVASPVDSRIFANMSAGGLASYGPSLPDSYRRAANYAVGF